MKIQKTFANNMKDPERLFFSGFPLTMYLSLLVTYNGYIRVLAILGGVKIFFSLPPSSTGDRGS